MVKKKNSGRKKVITKKRRYIHVTSGSGLTIAVGIVVVLLIIILTKLALI